MMSIRNLFSASKECRKTRRSKTRAKGVASMRPAVENLESRVVLYSASGNLWPAPQLITLSFVPDGTNINGYSSNLVSTFNARFGSTAAWQNLFLKAAQSWAAQTNVNFAVVSDNGAAVGSGTNQQGDPNYGDIRIGGYNFNSTALAMAYAPPPVNNYSVAGDVSFNTGQVFASGSGNDLFTIAAHEFGHSLGLGHSAVAQAEMYSTYNGIKPTLNNADDIAGIRSVYSAGAARSFDVYNSGGASNSTLATAADVTSSINTTTLTALVTNLNITTAGRSESFTFTAPAATTGTFQVVVKSAGLSLLAPKVTVYAADQTTVLGTATGLNQYGTTLTVSVSGVVASQQLYVKVQGADNTVFGTGTYAMTLNLGGNANPTIPLPITTLANGNPLTTGGGIADTLPSRGHRHDDHDHGHVTKHVSAATTRTVVAAPAHVLTPVNGAEPAKTRPNGGTRPWAGRAWHLPRRAAM